MPDRASRRIADYDNPTFQPAVANDARLAAVPAQIFDVQRDTGEYQRRVSEIQAALGESRLPLRWIVGNSH